MYHFFVTKEQIGSETITILGPDVNHIRNVLRMKPGEQILISNGTDRDYLCALAEITQEKVVADILSEDEEGTELPAKLILFQGLPKSDKMEFIIQKAVELGVYQIVPVASKRAVVKLDAKKEESKLKRWNAVAESAAKQSKRILIPQVTGVMSLKQAFVYAADCEVNLIAYENAEGIEKTRIAISCIQAGMKAGIFIGPEGGFDDSEIQAAIEHKIQPITLGKRILRTETAGMTVLSILMFQLES